MEEFNNCIGDLKENINYLFGKEVSEGNMQTLTAEDYARMLGVPINDVKKAMQELGLL